MIDDRWLIVIDMQIVFAEEESPWFVPKFNDIVPVITQLINEFGDNVAYTRFVPLEEPFGAWVDYYDMFPFARQSRTATKYSLISGLLPDSLSVATVDQPKFDKMGEQLRIATNGASEIVLAGVSTDTCVISTALSAVSSGISVTVIEDGCAGKSDESHQNACGVMAMYSPMLTLKNASELML